MSYSRDLRARFGKTKTPPPKGKGVWGGLCNRSACLRPDACYYNHGSHAYYCADCARMLNNDEFNKREAVMLWGEGKTLCEFQPTATRLPPRVWLQRVGPATIKVPT